MFCAHTNRDLSELTHLEMSPVSGCSARFLTSQFGFRRVLVSTQKDWIHGLSQRTKIALKGTANRLEKETETSS